MYYQQPMNMNAPPQPLINQADPVSKAVADNIMHGRLAPMKKLTVVRCYECNLDFTSQIVLDAHLVGARHAKKMRSKNIMATLKQTNMSFSKDEASNGLRCNPCNVLLNSIEQLQTHLNGNRHKKKLEKGDWNGKEIVSKNVNKAVTQPSKPITLLKCPPCRKTFNSQSQLEAHLASQKHADKLNPAAATVNPKKKRFFPYYKKEQTAQSTPPQALSNSFVSAGYQHHPSAYPPQVQSTYQQQVPSTYQQYPQSSY